MQALRLLLIGLLLAAVHSAVPAAGASRKDTLSDELFTNGFIRHLRIEIPSANLEILRGYEWRRDNLPDDRPEVTCTVREGNATYTNVAIHTKGSAGSFRSVDAKPALTLNFDKHVPEQRFHGLEKISLNNSVQDSTFVSEKLSRELYARAGLPVPRADYATVELNGRFLGLYVLVEGWNKQFLKRHFDNTKGNLYDPPLLRDIDQRLEVACGNFPQDHSELTAVVAAADEPDRAVRFQRLRRRLDVDRFARLVAMDFLTWNYDGYVLHSNNYRVFHDISEGRIVFMPHGLDQMFRGPDGPIMASGQGLVARAFLATPEGRALVLRYLREFRGSFYKPEALTERARTLGRHVAAAAARDAEARASRPAGSWREFRQRNAYTRHDEAVDDLLMRIEERFTSIDAQLISLGSWKSLGVGETRALTNWVSRAISGEPEFPPAAGAAPFGVRLSTRGAGGWFSAVWLEEGRYAVSGRVKTTALESFPGYGGSGAGFRVWTRRHASESGRWGGNFRRGGRGFRRGSEAGTLARQETLLLGTRDWTEVRFEFDLREPLADLEIVCEVAGSNGEAWFDPASLKLVRLTDACP